MNKFLKIMFCAPQVALTGFCLFGFMATFEPLPPGQQWTWRALYTVVAVICVGSIVRLWRRKRPAQVG